jgi:hypothetical protein
MDTSETRMGQRDGRCARLKGALRPKTRVMLTLKRLSFLSGFGAMYVEDGADRYMFSLMPEASICSPGVIGRFELSVSTSIVWH